MKWELQEKLINRYPKIFSRYIELMDTDTSSGWIEPIVFGIECGSGWYWLLDNLFECIQGYIENNKHIGIPQVVATQIKEKYGGLRFYYNGGDEYIEGMCIFAEDLSYKICEICGSTKDVKIIDESWIRVRCKECKDKKQTNINE